MSMFITQAIHRCLRQCPDAVAIEYKGIRRTYRQLAERVAKLAGALQALQLESGDRVALMGLNSDIYIEYIYGVPWAGGALNPVNIRWSASEVAYSLDDSETKILFVDEHFAPLVDEIKSKSEVLETVIYTGTGEAPAGCLHYEALLEVAEPVADSVRGGEDLLGVFYTGGTTGFPKGVMLGHNGYIASTLCLVIEGVAPKGVRFLHAAPMFHLADFAMLHAVTLRGGTHIVVPAFDAEQVLQTVAAQRVSQTLLVPTMVQMLLDHPSLAAHDISSLQTILYGASPMPLDTLTSAMQKMPNVEFIQAYGMTELSPLATISGVENHSQAAMDSGRIRTAGQPGLMQEVKIVDEQGKEVARGCVGEVVVRGPNVMQGYWGKSEATSEAVIEGWMHTGDGGYMDDEGFVFIVDRVKDMIITGGENVYSAEVENAITQHPDVAQCAVIGIPDKEWGEAVHAVIVAVAGARPSYEEIRAFSKELIAGYKCPRSVELMEALPLSGAGKVLKTVLREPYWRDQEQNVS